VLSAAIALAAPAARAQEPAVELLEIPQPVLGNLEQSVREQLLDERHRVEELVAQSAVEPQILATAFGELGQLYYLNDFNAPAEACYLNAANLDPNDFRWQYFLGALYPSEGRLEEAETRLSTASALRSDVAPVVIRLARVKLDMGKLGEAKSGFEEALALDPESAAAVHGLGRVAFENGDFEAAVEHFHRALELQPTAGQIHYQLGLTYRELGERELAVEHLKQNTQEPVLFDDPMISGLYSMVRSAKLHFNSAIDLLEQNRPGLAVQQFLMAIEANPGQFTYHHNLAAAYGLLGREAEAEAEYRKALELNPEYPNAHFNLAMKLVDRGEIEEAAEHLELAQRYDPEDLVAHIEWATALSRLGRQEQAAQELGKVLDRDPTNAKALLNLATVQAQMGRLTAAQATLEELISGDSNPAERARAQASLGKIYEQQGDAGRSIAAYRAAVEADDDFVEAQSLLAGLLARTGDFQAAAERFDRVLELDPDDLTAHYGRGLALILGESYPRARTALEESVGSHPENLPLVHLLARLLATAPDPAARDGARALELAQMVFDKEQTLDYAETIAMALAESGRFEEAANWQRSVIEEGQRRMGGTPPPPVQRRLEQYERGEPCRAPWRG
jgi:tetratricopeptide (TPR) repeat protein